METLKIYNRPGYSVFEVKDRIEAFDWKRIAEEINYEIASLTPIKSGNGIMLIEKLPNDDFTVIASMSTKLYNSTIGFFKNELKKAIKKAIDDPIECYDVEPYLCVSYDDETDTLDVMIENEEGDTEKYIDIENVEGLDLMVEDAFIEICEYFGF